MRHRHLWFALFFAAVACPVVAEDEITPIEGIGPTGPLQVIHRDLKFAEGPAADAKGTLYFTDVPAQKIYRVTDTGTPELVLDNSENINGTMFAADGRLIGCQSKLGRIVALDIDSGSIDVVADSYDGKPFNMPNDLVLDNQGGVYFTDPAIGTATQDKQAVYYVAQSGEVTRLVDDLKFPNGILLSPDEKTLYVLPYITPDLMAYPIEAPGKIGKGKALCQLPANDKGRRGGGDGLTVDTQGNLYLTAPRVSSIMVIDPSGETLGLIPLPEVPSNCTFGGEDFKTLYITTAKTLYALPMEAQGHRFAQP